MEDKNLFYNLGRRDEIAAFCALLRAGGVKYSIESIVDLYVKGYGDDNPHVNWVKNNIDKLKNYMDHGDLK